MTDNGQYDVNFFKVKTSHARTNKKLILSLAIIWAVAVFGFQFLLIIFNEETPEKSYTSFESLWPAVIENSEASLEDKQLFSRSILSVLGKNSTVTHVHQDVLKEMLSWNIYTMLTDSNKTLFTKKPNGQTLALAKETIGLASTGFDKIMVDLLPFSIVKVESDQLKPASIKALPGIMKRYLVHNQSALTNFNFIGFPFHYWYTAQFLLILFVVLCLIYAKVFERLNRKHNFIEEA